MGWWGEGQRYRALLLVVVLPQGHPENGLWQSTEDLLLLTVNNEGEREVSEPKKTRPIHHVMLQTRRPPPRTNLTPSQSVVTSLGSV